MRRQGLPPQEEQKEQSSQHQQRRPEYLLQPQQDEARSLQEQTGSQDPHELSNFPLYFQGDRIAYNFLPPDIQHYIVPGYLQGANLNQQVPQDFSQNLPQGMQNLYQTSDSDQQLRANNQQILNIPQHIPYVLSPIAESQPQQQMQHISQHAQRTHLQQHHRDQQSDQQSIQASNQLSRMGQQRRQDNSQSYPQHQTSQSAQQQQQWRSYQQQGRKNQQYRKQQCHQYKSQQSATQSHSQHQISQRRSENLPWSMQDEARSLSPQEQLSQQQLRSFQQHGRKDQQQRRQNQSVQASNQWSYGKPRHQDKSQQSATQSHTQHQIWQRSENLPQPMQDEARSFSSQEQFSKQQQQQQITSNTLATLSQLTLKDTRELDMASSTMKDCQARIPKRQRKPLSSKTASITVNTNMFKIIFKDNFLKKAVHYDVDIKQVKDNKLKDDVQTTSNRFSKALCRDIFEGCRKKHFENRYPAFDGRKNAYSANDLPFKYNPNILETTVEISTCKRYMCSAECNKHLRNFIVILKKVAEIDLSWTRNLPSSLDEVDGYQTGIQVLDIIMRHEPELRHEIINVGGSFFWKDDMNLYSDDMNLTGGLSAARGGFLSVILGQQIYLNVDVVHKAFVKPQDFRTLYQDCRDDTRTLNKLLKNLKVIYKIPKREEKEKEKYRSYRLDTIGLYPNKQKFMWQEKGREISVANYFLEHYQFYVQNSLRCLVSVVRGQQTYLLPELCTIESGQSVKKLNDEQTSRMIKIAAMHASDRKAEIETVFKKLVKDDNKDVQDVISNMEHEFRLSVETKMETVNARILNAPNIIYTDGRVNVNKGTWQMQKFMRPINLEENQWTILGIEDKNTRKNPTLQRMAEFMEILVQQTPYVNMHIGRTNTLTFKCFEKESINIKKYFQENKKFKLIIVIIPNSPGTIYNEIKQIAELELGILTQCIKINNFNKAFTSKGNSIIKNILLKINTKLNGINHALDPRPKCFEKICMFVGADVTHPSHDEDKPSIAAVTASNDIDGFQYNAIHKVLPSKQEIIMDLKNIIDVQLSIYKDKTSRLPERIIYYRDGVSEGQLPQVMHYEIEAIRDAYKNKCKSDIEITCLVVQKRHHVRFFPISSEQTYDEKNKNVQKQRHHMRHFPTSSEQTYDNKKRDNKNVQAGTIVDSKITHPSYFDFYLVSHESIQGTARPTRYKCICNDSNFTENEIEELTYYLCHMYARCTRTVSYPVPTYYAHLAAYRGKVLLDGYIDNDDRLREIQERFNTKMANLPMYFV